jgi:hypothetical protein
VSAGQAELDCLDILARAYMRGYAASATEVVETTIDGANAVISWVQRDVAIYGFGRGDNSGRLTVPLVTLVSQPAGVLAREQVSA